MRVFDRKQFFVQGFNGVQVIGTEGAKCEGGGEEDDDEKEVGEEEGGGVVSMVIVVVLLLPAWARGMNGWF